MKTIVITSQKGGSGKTTVAAHLAVAAELAGNGPAVLIDTDPQQTLATWWKARETESPKLAPVNLRELPAKLDTLRQMGFVYCFIDTPPALTEQNRQVLGLADLVLIPARPRSNETLIGIKYGAGEAVSSAASRGIVLPFAKTAMDGKTCRAEVLLVICCDHSQPSSAASRSAKPTHVTSKPRISIA